MRNRQILLTTALAATIGGASSLGMYKMLEPDNAFPFSQAEDGNVHFSNYANQLQNTPVPEGLNFVTSAAKVTPAVVHVKVIQERASGAQQQVPEFFRDFFDIPGHGSMPQQPAMGSGSGVIISPDGYIATNNHVVDGATKVEVVLEDKRSYPATVVGTDPTTDLALLKIEEKDLAYVPFGNSDGVLVGQWVLAVGNPFDLTSTVTAGIVSAKARNINILRERSGLAVESFIQTDAAVNPGNSGGALVDLEGNLVGINTAIASRTGSFAGYSFAVPANLVRKVMEDIKQYGTVQRGILGVQIREVNAALKEEKALDRIEGVYVAGVTAGSGAAEAGLREGDIITALDGKKINEVSALQEIVARKRPGEKVSVTYKRGGKEQQLNVMLKNTDNNTKLVSKPKAADEAVKALGIEIGALSEKEKQSLGLRSGVKVGRVLSGELKNAGMRDGFIITHVDREPVASAESLGNILRSKKGGVLIEGMYPNGSKHYYGAGL